MKICIFEFQVKAKLHHRVTDVLSDWVVQHISQRSSAPKNKEIISLNALGEAAKKLFFLWSRLVVIATLFFSLKIAKADFDKIDFSQKLFA